jgi:NADH dehydrogenase
MYAAHALQKRLQPGEARVTVVDSRPCMTYQPFLPEAAAGSIEPRPLVVPLRRLLHKLDVFTGRVTSIDHERRVAVIDPSVDEPYELRYHIVAVAPGSVARALPVPGLAEHGIGFKQVEEAIALRNQVLGQLDLAESVDDPYERRLLTFVFVGGGYAGAVRRGEVRRKQNRVDRRCEAQPVAGPHGPAP